MKNDKIKAKKDTSTTQKAKTLSNKNMDTENTASSSMASSNTAKDSGKYPLDIQQEKSLATKNEMPLTIRKDMSLQKMEDAPNTFSSHDSIEDSEKKAHDFSSMQSEYMEKGKEVYEHSVEKGKEFYEHSKEKAKEYGKEGVSVFQEFIHLLISFVTAFVPNFGDIFSKEVLLRLCKMIRIEHTVFALPFAYVGLLIVSRGSTNIMAFILITIAMFGIRSFAMTVNRIVDVHFDAKNPRTQDRALVTGLVTMGQAKTFAVINLLIFLVSCALISTTLLKLAIIPIALSVLYSYMKRFSWYCHFMLGAVLALAPIAGEIAIIGTVTGDVLLLSFGILFWVAGFDILYACQDADFDKAHGLYSIPSVFGIETALLVAKLCHVNTVIFFLLFGIFAGLSFFWYIVWVAIAGMLLWQHFLLSPKDLSKINHAFFTLNAIIAVAVLVGVIFS